MRGEGLHPHAGVGRANAAHDLFPFFAQRARIELYRYDRVRQPETQNKFIEQADKVDRRNRIGAAPAKSDPAHPDVG